MLIVLGIAYFHHFVIMLQYSQCLWQNLLNRRHYRVSQKTRTTLCLKKLAP